MTRLAGKVALVAGATRGAGRGIARALGESGATVYCSGRSSRGYPSPDPKRPETIEETAELVRAAGGQGIAVRCDHSDPSAVTELVSKIRSDHGQLSVLVNDIWGGDALTEWGTPFWQLDLAKGFAMLERAIHTHIITSRFALPLMLEGKGGLVVEVTDGAFAGYRGSLFYDLCKSNAIRLAYAMSVELEDRPVTALALTPGFLRSEAVLDHFGVTEETWREAIDKDPHFAHSETPTLIGRVIAALAADTEVGRWSGKALSTWELSRHYEIYDLDGSQPHWDDRLDESIEAILQENSPSNEDLMLLSIRKPQIDFDKTRADQRRRIESFLKLHHSTLPAQESP